MREIIKDYTYEKLKSNRISFAGAELYVYCNDILNTINLIWAFLNGTPFVYKQKPIYFDYTHIGIPIYVNDTDKYKDLVEILNEIGDKILGRSPVKTPYAVIDTSLLNVKMVDNMLDTPSKDYLGAITDILEKQGTSPFPDGTIITNINDFYTHIGIEQGSPISIYDVATNKFIQNKSVNTQYISFQVTGTETKAMILPDTFNASTLSFQILNPGTGYIAPYFFRALAANPLMGSGVALGLRIKVVSQENRSFAFDNNNTGTYWGVYGQKSNLLDATANPKELKAEEFTTLSKDFYNYIGLNQGASFKIKTGSNYVRKEALSGTQAFISYTTNPADAAEFVAEDFQDYLSFRMLNGVGPGYKIPFMLLSHPSGSAGLISEISLAPSYKVNFEKIDVNLKTFHINIIENGSYNGNLEKGDDDQGRFLAPSSNVNQVYQVEVV